MILVSQLLGFIISLAIGMTLVALVSWGVAALTTETIGWVAFGVFVFLCVNKSIIHAVEGYQGRKYESQMRKAS